MSEESEDKGRPKAQAGGVARRAFVAGGLGGIVASALARLQPAHADDVFPPGEPLRLGEDNFAFDTTGLGHTGPGPTLRVENPGEGSGIDVLSNRLPAVQASSPSAGLVGVGGTLPAPDGPLPNPRPITDVISYPTGVAGAGRSFGVIGAALPDLGGHITLQGSATIGVPIGVWGRGGPLPRQSVITATRGAPIKGIGVWGSAAALPQSAPISTTLPAAGILGTAFGPEQAAIIAHNPGGTALQVDGAIAVTCGGRSVVPRLRSEVEVVDASIRPHSAVIVTLTGNPGNRGTTVQYVEAGEGRMRVVLTSPPNRDLPFDYLCFELA
jgi:hypothetical protein